MNTVSMLGELERSLIGAVLINPTNLALLPDLASTDFATPWALQTWDAIRNLESRNLPIDVVSVGDEIARGKGTASDIETQAFAFLGECILKAPTIDNAIDYARRVRDHALHRRLQSVLVELLADARTGEDTGAELLSRALAGLSALDAETPESTATIGEILQRRLKQLDEINAERIAGGRTINGYPTGVGELDRVLGGWQPGIVSIVAARPGMGKSSLGLATADAATANGLGVHLFSLEDTEQAYADRALARSGGVSAESLRTAQLTRGQVDSIQRAYADLRKRDCWLFDGRSGITAQEIVRSVRRHKKKNNTKVAIVDYVQLVAAPKGSSRYRMSSHELLTEVVTTLADAAKQDRIAYVVMSQLNRDLEKRTDKRPQLADLRESGSLEERAKCVVGLYRGSEYGEPKKGIDFKDDYDRPTPEQFETQVQLLVLKNSNGRTGVVRATWNGPTTRIE